jgi:selenide,water dikinase
MNGADDTANASALENAGGNEPRLTALAHGGGCGCKMAPGMLSELLRGAAHLPVPEHLLVGLETADDAAVYAMNGEQAIVATTDFFTPIVDDPYDFGRIAATNAISDVYAMGATPIFALALLGMPVAVLPARTIRRVLDGGQDICRRAGIPIAGGHSIDSAEPIYGLVVIGTVHPDRILRNRGAQPGDCLVLGKPLGVGVYSAALKKDLLDAGGYAALIAATTQLNTPGPDLAALPGVHALTDVTGFGLAGHALEMARASGCRVQIEWSRVPLLAQARELGRRGCITGASGRNWSSYGAEVETAPELTELDRALLSDPQTSGGLLVSCAPGAVDAVLAIFSRHGFDAAAVIGGVVGSIVGTTPGLQVLA